MRFSPKEIYHVYNRGNQQKPIFLHRDNYIYFLNKMRHNLASRCHILAWCLMPNHFHLLLYADEQSVAEIKHTAFPVQQLTEGIRLMLSSYTKGFNKQHGTTGNLFQQKTKAKCVSDAEYSRTAFHYIHQNPMTAELVAKMEDWEFSSFPDYIGRRNGSLCSKALAFVLLDLDAVHLYAESYGVIPEEKWVFIFD